MHFWQNDRGLLRATDGKTGVERTPNKSQHTKLTPEKNNFPQLPPGFELATFRSRVRCSTNKLSGFTEMTASPKWKYHRDENVTIMTPPEWRSYPNENATVVTTLPEWKRHRDEIGTVGHSSNMNLFFPPFFLNVKTKSPGRYFIAYQGQRIWTNLYATLERSSLGY